jgi:hypothetical protein
MRRGTTGTDAWCAPCPPSARRSVRCPTTIAARRRQASMGAGAIPPRRGGHCGTMDCACQATAPSRDNDTRARRTAAGAGHAAYHPSRTAGGRPWSHWPSHRQGQAAVRRTPPGAGQADAPGRLAQRSTRACVARAGAHGHGMRPSGGGVTRALRPPCCNGVPGAPPRCATGAKPGGLRGDPLPQPRQEPRQAAAWPPSMPTWPAMVWHGAALGKIRQDPHRDHPGQPGARQAAVSAALRRTAWPSPRRGRDSHSTCSPRGPPG